MGASSGVAVNSTSFSFRLPEPTRAAAELLAEIRARGGRVYRMRAVRVCCLTDSVETAEWLISLGARHYSARGMRGNSSYLRARGGKEEWDLWINTIPVEGDLWEAAAHA